MLKNLKHYIFILLGIIYFIFYFYYKEEIFKDFILDNGFKISFSVFSSFVAFFTSFSVLSIILKSSKSFAEKLAKKKGSKIYPILSGMFVRFLSYTNYIVSIYLGFSLLIIPEKYIPFVNKLVSTIFIIIALLVLSNIVITIFEKRGIFQFRFANNLSLHLSSIIKKILLIFIWIIGGITIISNLGYDVSALLTGAGIGGLALALGAQKSLTNIFGAIQIVLNKPFMIGNRIKIGNTLGIVKDIGISYITIVDKLGHQVMIPNELIMGSFIENYSVRDNRRSDITIGLEYSIDENKVDFSKKIIEKIFDKYVENKLVENCRINFDNFGEYSINILITYYSLIEDFSLFLKQKDEILLLIKKEFDKENIKIAFPTRRLIMEI